MAEAGDVGCHNPDQGNKMCRKCFGLFQEASQVILSAHVAEQKLLFQAVEDMKAGLDALLNQINPKNKLHNSLVAEIKTTLQESVIMKKSYAGLRLLISRIDPREDESDYELREEFRDEAPLQEKVDSEDVLNYDNEIQAEQINYLQSMDAESKPKPLKMCIFSRESSVEDKAFTASIKNMYETASFSKCQGFNSEKKIVPTQEGMSDIDKKIKELEEEQCREEGGKFVAQLPGNYSILAKKHSCQIEGKSLEANTTIGTPANQMSINFAQEIKGDKLGSAEKSSQGKIEVVASKVTKKSDLMSLVYKVNSKVFEVEKFERKKSCIRQKDYKENMKSQTNNHAKTISDVSMASPISKVDRTEKSGINFEKRRFTPSSTKMGYSLRGGEAHSQV